MIPHGQGGNTWTADAATEVDDFYPLKQLPTAINPRFYPLSAFIENYYSR